MQSWKKRFEAELSQAQAAREAGYEGKARVCARRAAGVAAGEYMRRLGLPIPGPSVQERLNLLAAQPGLPEQASELIDHLLTRVDKDYNLPINANLIADARLLAEILLLI